MSTFAVLVTNRADFDAFRITQHHFVNAYAGALNIPGYESYVFETILPADYYNPTPEYRVTFKHRNGTRQVGTFHLPPELIEGVIRDSGGEVLEITATH